MKYACLAVVFWLLAVTQYAFSEQLYVAVPVTEAGGFTGGIEGPACDSKGNLYAVNYQKEGTIGLVTPDGKASVATTLPKGSVGNGIRFDPEGNMFIADYPKHNVLRIDARTGELSVFAHEPRMNQPNDLAIDNEGNLYASDPSWQKQTGQLWFVSRKGQVRLLKTGMGTTNGIEVSPDGSTLYVNESVQRNVWAFDINRHGVISNKQLLRKFDDFGFDGMRCDIRGNLYITRHGKGTVVVLSPLGEIIREIDVLGKSPTNICFGGPDGRTAYVTDADQKRVVKFRVEFPGHTWTANRAK
ncbi:MAG: SMP-30/gluconolactonase/LRE family protein [Planctomycetota bacterium]|nr:SMP-30/gluconolactonase/LRE family protein [Planctomycetota bacterium]